MSKIFGFLVMFCFSCSISFAESYNLDSDAIAKQVKKDRENRKKKEAYDAEYERQAAISEDKEDIKNWEDCKKQGEICTKGPNAHHLESYADTSQLDLKERGVK
jgi:hypothetical protein